jgi:TPR repeat protein
VAEEDLKNFMNSDDGEELLQTLRAKAAAGDLEAVYELGWRIAIGVGLPLNEPAAVNWLRQAAEGGHMLAQNNLGARYAAGDGVPLDLAEAYKWFHLAAEKGDRKAGKNRDSIAVTMTPEQLTEAKRRCGIA